MKSLVWGNVNPGLIDPKRLFNCEGTIKKYLNSWLLREYLPKPWFINPGVDMT